MLTSDAKLSSKSQMVVPQLVRERLNLKPGDRVRFVDTPHGVLFEKVKAGDGDDPFVTFTEWDSEADDKAYRDL